MVQHTTTGYIQDGCLPSSQKKALVTPALKKASLDVEELSSDLKLEFYVESD